MNFSEFTKQTQQEGAGEERTKTMGKDEVLKQFEELRTMDNSQLTSRLLSEVARQKKEGTFDYRALSESVENIRSYLPRKTYFELKKLLENLK